MPPTDEPTTEETEAFEDIAARRMPARESITSGEFTLRGVEYLFTARDGKWVIRRKHDAWAAPGWIEATREHRIKISDAIDRIRWAAAGQVERRQPTQP